jgi:hypothetical protein
MASGSYTADGTIQLIQGLAFKPDLVIIKGETTQAGVFRTSLMGGNSTAYLDSATANFTGGITAVNHDGFTIGDHATVNTSGITYHWQAFGGAWNPETKSGASDFYIGAYYGNTLDNRTITDLPFQADLLVVKRFGASGGVFKTSAHTGDTTSSFAATADVADYIQTINSDGFQVGNGGASINANGQIYFYFGFKEGTDFDVGTYSGNGSDNRDITNPGFDPDLAWIKRSTAVAGVTRPSTLAGDLTQYFITTAQAAGRIKSFVTGGFRLGTQTEVNASGGTYYYVTWDNNSSQNYTPADYAMKTGYYMGNGTHQEITGLGFRPEMIILKANTNAGHGSIYKTEYMPESAVNGLTLNSTGSVLTETSTYDITLLEDGFRAVGANANTVNVGYTWVAFAGSNCSVDGAICIGSYIGNASNPRTINTNFPPKYISVHPKSAEGYFTTRNLFEESGSGGFLYNDSTFYGGTSYFTSLNRINPEIGSTLNQSSTIYYFFAFAGAEGNWGGAFRLVRNLGGTAASVFPKNTYTDSSSNVFTVGNFRGTVDFDAIGTDSRTPNSAINNAFITKYNSNGSYGWTRIVNSPVGESSVAQGAVTDSSGNVFATGYFSGTVDFDDAGGTDNKVSNGGTDIFITKYNSNGSYGWTRTFGGLGNEGGEGISIDSDGNVFATGYFSGTVDFDDAGGTDNQTGTFFITKYNSDGSYGWTRAFGSSTGYDIYIDDNDNIFTTGSFTGTVDFDYTGGTDNKTPSSSQSTFITKHNSDGSYGWTRTFGNSSTSISNGISTDSSGNVFATGYFSGTVDFDDAGGTDNKVSNGGTDIFITKYNSDGSYGWTRTFGSSNNDSGEDISIDSDGNAFATGYFQSTVDFDDAGGTENKTSKGANDIFIVAYFNNGSYGWTRAFGSSEAINTNEAGTGIIVDSEDNIFVSGYKNSTVDFDDPGKSGSTSQVGSVDGFITKYTGENISYTDNNSDKIKSGSYVGDGTTRDITSIGFNPDLVFLKGKTSAYSIFNTKHAFGNNSNYFWDSANIVGAISKLITDGFTVLNNITSNSNAISYYYIAFKETVTPPTASGSFTMETGTYTGNGAYQRISGLSGKPDLLIIKGETTQQSVFRTKSMPSNSTAYLGSATANLGLAISSLNHDGFNVGNSATVNSSGITYHYQAFYGAYDELNGGSANFTLGHYYGNGINDRDITLLPFQPDMVTVKRSGATAGGFRTSAHTGDLTSLFAATADTADMIQTFNTDGFEIGTNAVVNTAANNYWWFAFKEGEKFDVGTYTGNATDNRDITDPAHTPNLVWIKRSTAVAGVMRPGTLAGDLTQWFINTAQAAGRIKDLIANGFTLGTQTEVNASGGTYYFASWSETGAPQPTFTQAAYRFFENTDTTDVGTALDTQDIPSTLPNAGDTFRLRLLLAIDDADLAIDGETFKLQYADKGAGTCASPSGGTPASYTDVTDSTLIAYNDNTTPADAATLTANANDPIDGARTIVNQSYQELNDFTNDEAAINNGQDGKWDFALVDNGANADTTFCFRVVKSDGTPLDTYTEYPEITTAAGTQSISFSISDNSVGFGNLSASSARYATGDLSGSGTDSSDAHTISVAATATDGYSLTVNGSTLTCSSCGGETIDAIGGTALSSSTGTEQFGLRLIVNSGTGVSTAPYASANWAFDTASLPDQVASGDGDGSTTEFGVRYIANTASVSEAGEYSATLTYTVTATY